MAASAGKPWTRPADVRAAAVKRWPFWLTAFLTGQEKARLDLLTPSEQDLYQDLVIGTFGPAVRLEQERVSFASLEHTISGREVIAKENVPSGGDFPSHCPGRSGYGAGGAVLLSPAGLRLPQAPQRARRGDQNQRVNNSQPLSSPQS